MRADQEDSGSILRGKGDDYPECAGEVRYTDPGEKIVTRQPVVKGCATACAQCDEELVIRAPRFTAQLAELLCGSFRYQDACRHRQRLPSVTALFAFLVEGEGRARIARIHLRQAFGQIRPVQKRLVPQLIPQVVPEIPILASRAQVDEKAQDCVQALRVEEQARPDRPGCEEAISGPCTDGLITHQQDPGGDGNPDWPRRRQHTVRSMNQARGLTRAFAFDGASDIEHFVHPGEQVPDCRLLALYR